MRFFRTMAATPKKRPTAKPGTPTHSSFEKVRNKLANRKKVDIDLGSADSCKVKKVRRAHNKDDIVAQHQIYVRKWENGQLHEVSP